MSSSKKFLSKKINFEEVNNTSDNEVVAQVLQGDTWAYKLLVDRYQTKIRAVALGVLGNQAEAEDVAQDAFLKAYKNLASFRGDSSFYTWLYRITFNLSLDLTRKHYRKSEISAENENSFDLALASDKDASNNYFAKLNQPEESILGSELQVKIDQAIEALTPEHKAVIILREVDGLSYEEIADYLKCSKGTVMSRLFHARKKLQQVLREFL